MESHFNKVADLQLHYKQLPTKVFSCEICEIVKNTYFEEHCERLLLWSSFLEVLCRRSCSTLINVVKYSFLAAAVQSWWTFHVNLLKTALHQRYFSTNFTASAELDGCFWGRTYFGNIPLWLLLKGSCKVIFISKKF